MAAVVAGRIACIMVVLCANGLCCVRGAPLTVYSVKGTLVRRGGLKVCSGTGDERTTYAAARGGA